MSSANQVASTEGTRPIALKLATRIAGLRSAVDPSSHTIVFTHVPKTGGITLDHIMRAAAAASNKLGYRLRIPREGPRSRPGRTQQLLDPDAMRGSENLANYDYLSGHLAFGIHRLLPRPCLYVTLLRDPVARLLSNVRFGLDRSSWSRDTPVKSLMERGRLIDNLQTRQIAGVADRNAPCTPKTLAMALENLQSHYAVVGTTERFDDTLKTLITLLGWPDIAYSDRQVSMTPSSPELEENARVAVERYFAFDAELYAYASTRAAPWAAGILEGTATGNQRQETVLLTSPSIKLDNRPFALLSAEVFDGRICPFLRQRGGSVAHV